MGIGRGGGPAMPGGFAQTNGGIYQAQMGGHGGRGGRSSRGGAQDPNNVSMLSINKQTKCYVERLRQESMSRPQGPIFDY